ncbi:zinc-binding dehydrogenase [Polaromonas sp. P1(28)-8]|nr:zinc-binding dehydrogenase [Polaromonas sp. P1(28)-8]
MIRLLRSSLRLSLCTPYARAGCARGDACAVFGMGPVGLLTVAMLRQCGAGEIVAVDVHAHRLALAAAIGASRGVDATREDSASAVFAATSGRGAAVAFEVAGLQATLDGALACVRKGGEAVLVGLMGKAQVDIFDIVNRELRLTASVGYRDVFPTLIAWTSRGLIDPSTIVTRKVLLAQAVPQGFDALLADKDQVKVLVAPNGEDVK